CKRLPGAAGLPIVAELLRHGEDAGDPHVPLLLWWAVEAKANSDRERVLALFDSPDFWRLPLVNKCLAERIGRRYLAEGSEPALQPLQAGRIADGVIGLYPRLSGAVRAKAQALLCGRPATALQFLRAVDDGRIAAKDVPLEQLQQILLHDKEPLNRLVEKHWG